MRPSKPLMWLLLLTGLVPSLVEHHAWAQEKQEKGVIYAGEVIGPKEVPEHRDFNVSKEEDRQELTALLHEGKVVELVREKDVNPLALAWDLGIWTIAVFGLLYFFLRKLVWTPMLDGLQKREDNIRSAV